MSKTLDLPAVGETIIQPGIGLDTPDTETAAVGAMAEVARIPTAQTERPVDIMKVGGKILTHQDIGGGGMLLNNLTLERVGDEIAHDPGDIALVTSAAISSGMLATGLRRRPDKDTEMPELQRLSSVGRRHIENAWARALRDREIGGLSLTKHELDEEARRGEALRVIQALFAHREIPVINENDAITHEEIEFGSNDILAARLAARMQESDLFGTVRLFLLTDVNGVYERRIGGLYDKGSYLDPRSRIPIIENTDEYRHVAGGAGADHSIGGMASKFDAADIAKAATVDMWIYNPLDGPRTRAVDGEIGTYFPASPNRQL